MHTLSLVRGVLITALLFGLSSTINAKSSSSKLQAGDRYLTIVQTTDPLLRPGFGVALPASGEVRAVINVDADGKLVDYLLVKYTNPHFAKTAERALKEWEYKPAIYQGVAVGSRKEIIFSFDVRGQVVSLTGNDAAANFIARATGEQVIRNVYLGRELDEAPRPLKTVQPPAVTREKTSAKTGVMVDFYIDETGRPRMPVVDQYESEQVALAAVYALEQWRFSVPTYRGKPVAVRAKQWFAFGETL